MVVINCNGRTIRHDCVPADGEKEKINFLQIDEVCKMPVTLDISEARRQFNTLDERLRQQPVIIITRHNKEAFALIDMEHLAAIRETMEVLSDPESLQMFQDSIADIRAGRLHDHEDVKREFL